MASGARGVVQDMVTRGWNAGDMDVVDRCYARNCVSYAITSGLAERTGVAAQKEWVIRTRKAFPDLHMTIESIHVARDHAVTRWTATGTQRGEWLGLPATQRQATWGGITIHRFMANKIQEEWVSMDIAHALQDLGHVA